MKRDRPQRRMGWWGSGLLLAMLAVLSPIVLGPVVHAELMRQASSVTMSGGMAECGDMGGTPSDMPADAPGHHHGPDCAICPLCAALANPAIGWMPAPTPPAPSIQRISRPELPPAARAPPALHASAAQPRGPPTQV